MKKFLLFLILFSPFVSIAQCPTGSVSLTNQAEVDDFVANFPDCTQIDGDLTIGSSFVASSTEPLDLTGLSSINEVFGTLFIRRTEGADAEDNPIPGSLEGLENIESVDNLYVGGSPDFNSPLFHYASLEPLNGLSGNIGELFLTDVFSEAELPPFENLTGVDYYRQGRVTGVTSSPTFPNVIQMGDLTITGSFMPFEDSLFTTVVIPPLLDSIADFEFPFGGLFIFDTWNVTEIIGGENLDYLQSAVFDRNISLSDLSAFSDLTTIGFGGLSIISNNPGIFDSFQSLQSIEPGSEVNLSYFEDPEDCMELSEELVVGVSSQVQGVEISAFPLNITANCVENITVTGNFANLTKLDITAQDATTITGFAGLDSITESRFRMNTPNISQLPEFQNLVHVEGDVELRINSGDWALEDLSGLSALTTVGGDLNIGGVGPSGGESFVSLDGLENLNQVEGRLRVRRLEALTDISALSNLVSVETFELDRLGSLSIAADLENLASVEEINVSETNLTVMPNFPLVTSLSGDLDVEDNLVMESLGGLDNIESIGGSISVNNNPALNSIVLPDDIVFSGELTIQDNSALEDCGMSPSICNLLGQSSVSTIMNNGQGCTDPSEVLTICTLSSDDNLAELELTPFVNGDQLVLESNTTIQQARIDLFSVEGKRVYSQSATLQSGQNRFQIPALPAGIYLLSVQNGESSHQSKLFVNPR